MTTVSRVRTVVSNHENLHRTNHNHGVRKITQILDDFGKYVVDFAVNFSSKSDLGRRRLHKTVQEEIKDQGLLKPCNHSEKHDAILREKEIRMKTDEMQEEMSTVKHKILVSAEKLDPLSSFTSPPEQVKDKDVLLPNKKRIMIRSRL